MNARPAHRGGFAIGRIIDLDPVEAGAVLYLRLWCQGSCARMQIQRDFIGLLGPACGEKATIAIDEICDVITRHGRRPLMRHNLDCQCLGLDEACFANFIAAASEGDREDAALIATMLVRADLALCLLHHAETLGLALKRIALNASRPVMPAPSRTTVH
jgi:hypothetical protein